jgi:hypothetical protein
MLIIALIIIAIIVGLAVGLTLGLRKKKYASSSPPHIQPSLTAPQLIILDHPTIALPSGQLHPHNCPFLSQHILLFLPQNVALLPLHPLLPHLSLQRLLGNLLLDHHPQNIL